MRIYHLTRRADWIIALRFGRYSSPTQEQDGYVAAARRDQIGAVLEQHSGLTEPVVVLEIETELLDVPWEEVEIDGVAYPRVLGSVSTRAVLDAHPSHSGWWSEAGLKPMSPPVVQTFAGLGTMLTLASLALLVASGVAHRKAHPSVDGPATVSHSVEFLLWSLTLACAVTAATAWVFAGSLRNDYRRRTAWRP